MMYHVNSSFSILLPAIFAFFVCKSDSSIFCKQFIPNASHFSMAATQHGTSVLLSIHDTYTSTSLFRATDYIVKCIPLCDWIVLPISYNISIHGIWIHHLQITDYTFYVQPKNVFGVTIANITTEVTLTQNNGKNNIQ